MTNPVAIKNDSIVLNDMLTTRLGAERLDLLDSQYHGELTFTIKKGMIVNWKSTKSRQVKR